MSLATIDAPPMAASPSPIASVRCADCPAEMTLGAEGGTAPAWRCPEGHRIGQELAEAEVWVRLVATDPVIGWHPNQDARRRAELIAEYVEAAHVVLGHVTYVERRRRR